MKLQPVVHYKTSSIKLLNRGLLNMDDKKKFEKPELEVVEFENEDIITASFGDVDPKPGDINGWW